MNTAELLMLFLLILCAFAFAGLIAAAILDCLDARESKKDSRK